MRYSPVDTLIRIVAFFFSLLSSTSTLFSHSRMRSSSSSCCRAAAGKGTNRVLTLVTCNAANRRPEESRRFPLVSPSHTIPSTTCSRNMSTPRRRASAHCLRVDGAIVNRMHGINCVNSRQINGINRLHNNTIHTSATFTAVVTKTRSSTSVSR